MYQADGFFSVRSGSKLWFVNLDSPYRNGSYYILSANSSSAVLIAANGAQLSELSCTALSSSCFASRSTLLPLTSPSSNPVLSIIKDDIYGHLILASADTLVRFDAKQFSVLSSLYWKPSFFLSVNSAVIRQSGSDHGFYISYANSNNLALPGMVVKVDGKLTTSIITYMAFGSSNFSPTRSSNANLFWTESNVTSRSIYVNSFIGNNPSMFPTPMFTLDTNECLAPTFVGEYPMNKIGAVAVASTNKLTFDLQCLKLSYGLGPSPPIILTKRSNQGVGVGMPFLGIQMDRSTPTVTAIAVLPFGYGVVDVDFSECPTQMGDQEMEILTQNNQKMARPSLGLRSACKSTHQTQSSSAHANFSVAGNCVASSCSFISEGDCQNQQCWALEHGSFSCCKSKL